MKTILLGKTVRTGDDPVIKTVVAVAWANRLKNSFRLLVQTADGRLQEYEAHQVRVVGERE